MHEYSIIQSLVDSVEKTTRERPGATVHSIDVRIGELSGVDCKLLATAYDVFRAGTVCEHATMSIERVPARWNCPKCQRDLARGAVLRCPVCNGPAELADGDEIILQRIELEVA